MRAVFLMSIAAVVATMTVSSTSNADPPFAIPQRCTGKQLCWAPSFNRMDIPEMVLTGAAASIALAANIVHPLNTGWSGGIFFDDAIRSALRLHSVDAQLEVRSGTDLGLAVMTSYPFLVDSLIVAYWYRGSADVALQMALIDAEAFAITGAIEGISNFVAGRARPYAQECGGGIPSNTTDCSGDTLNRSFFSGHSAVSFTAAALICAHHEALHLFDSAAADHAACIAGFTAATAIGVMRIVGDAHYFSDVFIGALVGTTVGLTIPLLHHYNRAGSSKSSPIGFSVVPGFGTATVVGTF
ncbi:MAG TPA: phosphatase PAP2 family protein [Polyangiaceae bacterium]|jgi:membrane-associated phospholipid phosphatase